jgi:large conductance mechanosensitive channel
MGLVKEFREFALKGNMLDLAVAVIIGAATGKIVNSLIEDIIMPPIGLILGRVDFSQMKAVMQQTIHEVKDAKGLVTTAAQSEVAIHYGKFITNTINFVILTFIIFLVVKAFNTARKRFEADKPAPAPAGPTPEQKLLTEIRDLLARR